MTGHQSRHLVCFNCGTLLDCDWMGISIDYDDECVKGGTHVMSLTECDCESKVVMNERH